MFNVVTGPGEPAGAAIVDAPGRRHGLAHRLAGHRQVDRAAAAETLKRVHLELGGKAPVVVFDDVDDGDRDGDDRRHRLLQRRPGLHRGHPRARRSKGVYDDVVNGLVGQAKGLVLGDTHRADTTLGPLNSQRQRERVEGFLERKRGNAEIVTGGSEPDLPGFFLEPTVVAGLEQDDEMIQKEIFGPVITVQPFCDEERRSSGRTAPATASPRRSGPATSAARCGWRTRCGSAACGSTTTSRSSREMPHGGYKQSGYGKDLSMYALEDYTAGQARDVQQSQAEAAPAG